MSMINDLRYRYLHSLFSYRTIVWFCSLFFCILDWRNNTTSVFRCIQAKGEEAEECNKYAKYYRSLCPNEWVCLFSCNMNLYYSFLQFMYFCSVLCVVFLAYLVFKFPSFPFLFNRHFYIIICYFIFLFDKWRLHHFLTLFSSFFGEKC